MMRTCMGFAITTCLTCGAITAATDDAFPVASITTTSSFESFFAKASRRWRRMSTRPSRLSSPSSQATASAKARWISNPMIRMPAPPSLFVQSGSWRATRHLLIRAHGASGKVARGGHVTSSGSQPTVYRRPARTFVLPAPRRMGSPYRQFPFRKQPDNEAPADLIPDNGQVERMNRTIKDATVKRYLYDTHDQLRAHLQNFVNAYNFARRLKTLRGLTPYEFICKAWTSEPQRFKISPLQQMPGLNSASQFDSNLPRARVAKSVKGSAMRARRAPRAVGLRRLMRLGGRLDS